MAIDNAIRLAEEIARGSANVSVEPVVQALDSTQAISGDGVGCECAAAAARGSRADGGNGLARSQPWGE